MFSDVDVQSGEKPMKIFIAGATGVLGRWVLPKLIAAGYQVVGLSRSPQNEAWLQGQQAIPRTGDLFDAAQMVQITADCDAILHLATAIPTKSRTSLQDWQMNDRIRREGARALLAAARQHRCQLYLQQSVTYLYGDRQGAWVDETTPLPAQQARVIQSALDMERLVQAAAADGLPTVILRFGTFYAPAAAHTQAMFDALQKGFFPIIGRGDNYWNLTHLEDAATAIVKTVATHQHLQGQTFNVVDDEPVSYQSLMTFLATQLGARKPLHLPVWLGKLAVGAHLVENLMASVRCCNQQFKAATGWQPTYPTYRQGMTAAIAEWQKQVS
jgi:nucleoside-diphosphate-sugar epimerase